MWVNEYDEEKVHADFFEDGFEQGIERGEIRMLVKQISLGLLTTSQAAELAEMTEADFISAAGLC